MRSAKFIAIFIAAILVLLPGVAHAQAPFRGMKLLTQNTGWAARGRQLYWTNDFGQDWREITPPGVAPHGPAEMADVFFLNTSDGWVLLRKYTPGGPYGDWSFEIASTDDSGITWSVTPVAIPNWDPKTYALGGSGTLDFVDPAHGWLDLSVQSGLATDWGVLLATTDGGSEWERLSTPAGFGALSLVSAETGWVAGGPAAKDLYVTRDGGRSWRRVRVPAPPQMRGAEYASYVAPVFLDARRGFLPVSYTGLAAGGGSATLGVVVFATADGGRTWRPAAVLRRPNSNSLGGAIALAIADHMLLVPAKPLHGRLSSSSFAFSTAGAPTLGRWPSQSQVTAVSFACAERGWTLAGGLYATTDGGATWTDITPGPHVPRISRHAAR